MLVCVRGCIITSSRVAPQENEYKLLSLQKMQGTGVFVFQVRCAHGRKKRQRRQACGWRLFLPCIERMLCSEKEPQGGGIELAQRTDDWKKVHMEGKSDSAGRPAAGGYS